MSIRAAYIVPHPPIIIPSIGQRDTKNVQTTIDQYHAIAKEIAEIQPKTLIIISPHQPAYADYFHIKGSADGYGDFASFGAPDIKVKATIDQCFLKTLCKTLQDAKFPAGMLGNKDRGLDHGVTVPLYFIQQYIKNIPIVVVSLSNLSRLHHYQLGQWIQKASDAIQKDVVLLASGDFSHKLKADGPYGYVKEGEIFDDRLVSILKAGNFLELLKIDEHLAQKAAECGLRSFIIMAGALDGYRVDSTFYSYEKPFGVGYGIFAYRPQDKSSERKFLTRYQQWLESTTKTPTHPYVKLAKKALENYVKTREVIEGDLEEERESVPGIFVSLKLSKQLRGCIGTVQETKMSLSKAIINYAIEAGINDPRFAPVSENELPFLEYRVDILSEPAPIKSLDNQDVDNHGLIVVSGDKSGVLLPNIEGIDQAKKQLEVVLDKAGIAPKETYNMYRFTVQSYQ